MSTDTNYISDQEFRDYIRTQSSDKADLIADAIASASRAVDSYCGRHFYTVDTSYYFCADDLWYLRLDSTDIATATGLELRTDDSNAGTYGTLWTITTDFVLEPINATSNGLTGMPYTRIRAVGSKTFPLLYLPTQRDTVKITGTFGFVEVPVPVKQATKVLAAQFYKLSDAPLGVAGFGDMGIVRVRDIPQVASLLSPYRKGNSFAIG